MNNRTSITEITADTGAQLLQIVWGDGEEANYPLDGLRRICPCVYCRGGHEAMGQKMRADEMALPSRKNWTIRQIRPVGNYALQITWEDGHNTGLYRFDALRDVWEDYKLLPKQSD